MAIIQNDPSQGKTVAALIVVLVLAVGVTIFRVQRTQSVRASVIQVPTAMRAENSNMQSLDTDRPYRNPFKKPLSLEDTSSGIVVGAVPSVQSSGMLSTDAVLPTAGQQVVGPISIEPIAPVGYSQTTETQSDVQEPEEIPTFVLLTTVLSDGKSSAVIRIGDSTVKAVRVGDMVNGRFKLISVKYEEAVLSDGKSTVIAKRGLSENEKSTTP